MPRRATLKTSEKMSGANAPEVAGARSGECARERWSRRTRDLVVRGG